MGIQLQVNGIPYENFISADVQTSMDNLSGAFDFVATIDKFSDFPIKLQDKVVVIVDGVTRITGFIEVFEPSYSSNSHTIRLSGRDRTCDVIDSDVIEPVTFKGGRLRDIIFKLLSNNNIPVKNIKSSQAGNKDNEKFIGIIDLVEPDIFTTNDIAGAVVGENMFELINKYCMKRQVLATTDGFGNIVLTRGGKELSPVPLIYRDRRDSINETTSFDSDSLSRFRDKTSDTRENNILSASATYSTENRFNTYQVKTQMNPNALSLNDTTSSESIVNQKGIAFDSGIKRVSRSMVISADNSNTSQTATDRAIWETNIRRARSETYNCTIQGFSFENGNEGIWKPNILVWVEDENCAISSQLLIRSVNYSFSSSGSITKLELIAKDSYTLQAEQNSLSKKTNKLGPII